jgi:hypothetical protein
LLEAFSQIHQLSRYWMIAFQISAFQGTGLSLFKILRHRISRYWGYRSSKDLAKASLQMARRADNFAYWRSCLKRGWSLESGASSPKGMCQGGTGRTIK